MRYDARGSVVAAQAVTVLSDPPVKPSRDSAAGWTGHRVTVTCVASSASTADSSSEHRHRHAPDPKTEVACTTRRAVRGGRKPPMASDALVESSSRISDSSIKFTYAATSWLPMRSASVGRPATNARAASGRQPAGPPRRRLVDAPASLVHPSACTAVDQFVDPVVASACAGLASLRGWPGCRSSRPANK